MQSKIRMIMAQIHIERTENPAILKFVCSKMLTKDSFEYNSIDDAGNSALVQQLFHLPFVKKVFISANFIAVEKFDILNWVEVQSELQDIFQTYITQNDSVFAQKENKTAAIEVYAESTPNPNAQKFVTNKLLTSQNIEVLNLEDAKHVPMAQELYNFPYVKEIFISQNYISITKTPDSDWFEINTEVRDFIKEYIQNDKRIVSKEYQPKKVEEQSENIAYQPTNDTTSKEIIAVLEEYIKPAVAGDGGNIQFLSYLPETKEVNVMLQGACNGCPSSTITLKNGIEATLKQLLPGKIETVNALN